MAKANASARTFGDDDSANTEAFRSIAIGGILVVVALVVALTVLPVLTSSVADAQADPNTTASQAPLLGVGAPITSKWEHFHEWKRLAEDEPGAVDMETLLKGVCDKRNFMDLLENFILFDSSSGETFDALADGDL